MTSHVILYVVYTHRGSRIRFISARGAENDEQDRYRRQTHP
jgi:uncharacterized DUF497 family protein